MENFKIRSFLEFPQLLLSSSQAVLSQNQSKQRYFIENKSVVRTKDTKSISSLDLKEQSSNESN